MGLAVDLFERFLVRTLGKAEHRSRVRAEPVRQVADSVTLLHLDIELVSSRNILGRRAGSLVAVHEHRHSPAA
jgi:hypothetical protein